MVNLVSIENCPSLADVQVAEAVDSVLAQDFSDFELILSDDCSGDGSREIIEAYAARDPRIRIQVHEANIGMVQNWNWCLSQARGEYLA